MSHTRKPNKKNKSKKSIPTNALLYCPDYIAFDKKARMDSKMRFREHVVNRRNLLVQCIDAPIAEIRNPILALELSQVPRYIDNDDIINGALNTVEYEINRWDGVQFSKKFIGDFNKTGKIMDAKKFDTIAKNHQDQTSWKISGNKFFAPYIAHSKQYLYSYCQCIINIDEDFREEMYKLSCISYAVCLLTKTIKFHRTKPKPLIRHKTLVKSGGIHIELEKLYSPLKVRAFISAAKKKRKAADGKTTIIAKTFHEKLLNCCNTLYREQRKKVYNLCGISMDQINDDLKEEEQRINVYPEDLIGSDGDINHNGYEPYESPLYSAHSTNSTHSTRSRSRGNHNYDGIPREFQHCDSRDYSIRTEMNRDLKNQRKRMRKHHQEINIQQIHDNIFNTDIDIDNIDNDNDNDIDYLLNNNNNTNTPQSHDELLLDVNNQTVSTFNNLSIDQVIGDEIDCTQCGRSCHCELNPISIDNNTINSQSSSSDSNRICQQLQRENEDLKRQKDILLQQMHSMNNPTAIYINQPPPYDQYQYPQHPGYIQQQQQQHINQPPPNDQYQYTQYPEYTQQQQQQQQYIIPATNDNMYFNALPPQLQYIQPPMIIRGSSLNNNIYINNNNNNHNNNINDDMDLNTAPPFIENTDNILMNEEDIDIADVPSLPHSQRN